MRIIQITPTGHNKSCCLKLVFGDYTISVSLDNNLGVLDDLGRAEIRIFKGVVDEDVTEHFENIIYNFKSGWNNEEDLFAVMKVVRDLALSEEEK